MANQFDTQPQAENRNLPAVIGPRPARRPSRFALPASFASQLIAARDRMAPQRARRLAPAGVAADAYRTGSTITVRRMPAGYTRTLTV